MINESLIQRTEIFVQEFLKHDATGHDWWHIHRVNEIAKRLATEEGADPLIVELAALLHDVADHKLNDGDEQKGMSRVEDFLRAERLGEEVIQAVLKVIREVSYKGAGVPTPVTSIESAVVQDADRLDAMGAVGIARMFTFGGAKGRAMFDPNIPPVDHHNEDMYRNAKSTTFNHFHEKLLLLKDRMNTAGARRIAEGRHQYMAEFMQRFKKEWEGLS